MPQIDQYLKVTLERDASDCHFIAGDFARARIYGELTPLDEERLRPDMVRTTIYEIMNETTRGTFEETDGADFAYSIPEVARFRVNVFRHLGGIGAIFRAIPARAMTLEELNMPDIVKNMCLHKQGLILVTGKTGSGKSTTLAAMVDSINRTRRGHILTIEDPIEFVHHRKNCMISQREVGIPTQSFAAALHSALREDPDVILVGELRDLETVSIAVTAAETGILVMGTLHTNGAAQTVDRLINQFPTDKQAQIRTMLATSIRGVVSQQLTRKADGKGRVAALEIMVSTTAISNLIRQGKIDQIENAIQSGGALGMQTMDSALKRLVEGGRISGKEAYEKAYNKATFAEYATAS